MCKTPPGLVQGRGDPIGLCKALVRGAIEAIGPRARDAGATWDSCKALHKHKALHKALHKHKALHTHKGK